MRWRLQKVESKIKQEKLQAHTDGGHVDARWRSLTYELYYVCVIDDTHM